MCIPRRRRLSAPASLISLIASNRRGGERQTIITLSVGVTGITGVRSGEGECEVGKAKIEDVSSDAHGLSVELCTQITLAF